jgi:hypothetical protein
MALVFFLAMLACLAFGVWFLRRGDRSNLLTALTLRVGLAVVFFLLLMLAWYAGLIEPHGLGG